jgi:hypothetical protein
MLFSVSFSIDSITETVSSPSPNMDVFFVEFLHLVRGPDLFLSSLTILRDLGQVALLYLFCFASCLSSGSHYVSLFPHMNRRTRINHPSYSRVLVFCLTFVSAFALRSCKQLITCKLWSLLWLRDDG